VNAYGPTETTVVATTAELHAVDGRAERVPIGRPLAGTRVYVANLDSDNVSVIDTATNAVVATIPVGTAPIALGQFIGPAVVAPPATKPDLNQHGLTGSWYEAATSGQGIEVEVFPNPSSGTGSAFVSWFTYDTVGGGAERQRWYTAQGPVVTGQPNAALTIYRNTGGNFDAPPVTHAQAVGTATLTFDTCSSGQLSYSFTDGTGRTGSMPLTRLTQNVTCSATAARPTNADFALSGNWYEPATSGQGLTVEVNPISRAFFSAWYTYAPNGAASGAAGQRWYTAQATFTAGLRSIPVTFYETTGGVFDQPTPPGQSTVPVGTGTMAFQSCSAATLSYHFTGGTSGGQSGTITLSRVGPLPPGCNP
jgi:YVTN family beta-propeller protein